ncbi:MAG: hypothetical protein COV57_01660 [Candidatus Liptonbacteria bacterium CG11_big_fil_rev_8_21_14_0_20_35_14]|uniref:Toxin HicA n=1 Tax=Candidatus Liptonbacteria bacterium CG11_big_fil_rev_8_21_14_0_20_35_14 TaxID=1974634 RepID=A0A2H0N7U4_9BACT|nr:MAG: hypothetical protein COV57_01660 [Candidatus Liptonbacteria bacterium CG11_big_fil_rev_8_21_14_0_20_35_14]
MSKKPSLNFRKVVKIIKEAGFELDHTSGSHYVFYNPVSKMRVVVPYHNKDLPKGTLITILKQAGIK